MSNPKTVEGARNAGLEEAAQICESWGDQCAGGSGREIVPSGPNKGQMYGQAYYNLAESIRRAMKPVEAALSAAPARDGVREAKGEGAPPTKCGHGIWIGRNCWQCDNDIPAQPSELPIREMAQEILKPHWPVVHNMEENAAREREVDRIEAVLRRAAKEQADGQ